MVPAPSSRHQRAQSDLLVALHPVSKSKGLVMWTDTGVYSPTAGERDYRIPDLVVAAPQHISERGIEGRTELAVEIRSPNDESYDKLDFYAAVGVEELLVIDLEGPSIELFSRRDRQLRAVAPGPDGALTLSSLGVAVQLDGDTLRLRWDGGSADIVI